MKLSFQLYSAREHGPWSDVFEQLAALGYSGVEGYGALYENPVELAEELTRHGLSMPTGHVAVETLESDPDSAFEIARTLGMETIFAPYLLPELRPVDAEGWRAFGARLAQIATRVKREGFGFGWHNHDFEFVALADGSVPFDILMTEAPDMEWEADFAWVARAGADPVAWAQRYGSRVGAVHIKDIASAGQALDEDGWADPGDGTMDWPALIAEMGCQRDVQHWIVEHDKPSDLKRFAQRGMAAWRQWKGLDGDAGRGA